MNKKNNINKSNKSSKAFNTAEKTTVFDATKLSCQQDIDIEEAVQNSRDYLEENQL